jgi:DNA-binding SARP family transcriptional activator
LAPPRAGVLALRAFGRFEVRQDGVLLDAWPRRKAKLLLAALALHPDGLRAGELAELIAGEEANPLNVLRVNAWALRRALEPALGRGEDSAYVRREGDRYALAWELVEGFDLRAFEAALAQAAPLRTTAPRAAIATLEAGLALVRGPLFDDGPPFDLFEADRERCRRQAGEALAWIAAQHRQVGAYDRAEAALERAIALAPCDEAGYDALMRLRRARGDAAGVRRAYWDLRRALKTGLGLVPTPELDALYRRLTGDR